MDTRSVQDVCVDCSFTRALCACARRVVCVVCHAVWYRGLFHLVSFLARSTMEARAAPLAVESALTLPIAIGKIETTIWKGHRQWASTKQKVCGMVLGDVCKPRGHAHVIDVVTRRCPAKVEPIAPHVFLWEGLD